MMPVPNIFCNIYHNGKFIDYPATQDVNSALRQERQGFLHNSLKMPMSPPLRAALAE